MNGLSNIGSYQILSSPFLQGIAPADPVAGRINRLKGNVDTVTVGKFPYGSEESSGVYTERGVLSVKLKGGTVGAGVAGGVDEAEVAMGADESEGAGGTIDSGGSRMGIQVTA